MNRRAGRPRRQVDGVLLLDKPAGLTSNACLGVVKRLFNAASAGHTGTLDPFATGLLPVALGEATKFSQGLLEADKTYRAVMRLGVRTTTGDIEGDVVETLPACADEAKVRAAMERFRGPIDQVPPMHSALKRDGRPLYEYARAGITLERAARRVTIHRLDWLSRDGDDVAFRVRCSKGTYVRTLAEDIGGALGCGAHLRELRREAVGDLTLEGAHTPAALEAMTQEARDACLGPLDALVSGLPRVALDAPRAARLMLGQRVPLEEMAPDLPACRAYGADGRFLGLVRIASGVAHPLRLVAAHRSD